MNKDKRKAFDEEFDIYTLDEASAKKRCSILSILEIAANSQISLCTTIPIAWEIYSINITDLPACQYKQRSAILSTDLEKDYNGTFEKADPLIELLTLSTEDCKKIKEFNHTKQGAFISGLKTSYNLPPLPVAAVRKRSFNRRTNINDCLPTLTRCFAICKKPTPNGKIIELNLSHFPYQEISITKDMIRITSKELEKILESITTCDTQEKSKSISLNNSIIFDAGEKQNLKSISKRIYTPGRARTKLLEALYRAAKKTLQTYITAGNYPSSTEVENYIKKFCLECSDSLAKKSATMIRPPADNRDSSSELFLTNYFWALIAAYEKFYRQAPFESKIAKTDILYCLENDFGFETSFAIDGSRIIDPDFEANKSADT